MSGWNNAIDTSDVKVGFDALPAGRYVLQFLSGRPDTFEEGALNVKVQVASGQEAGRQFYSRLPNYERFLKEGKQPWPLVAMKKIEVSTGIEKYPSETGPEYITRLAQTGATFAANVSQYDPNRRPVKNDDGSLQRDAEGQIVYEVIQGSNKKIREQLEWLSIGPGLA